MLAIYSGRDEAPLKGRNPEHTLFKNQLYTSCNKWTSRGSSYGRARARAPAKAEGPIIPPIKAMHPRCKVQDLRGSRSPMQWLSCEPQQGPRVCAFLHHNQIHFEFLHNWYDSIPLANNTLTESQHVWAEGPSHSECWTPVYKTLPEGAGQGVCLVPHIHYGLCNLAFTCSNVQKWLSA